jgi:hypothetical protein
MNKVTYALSGYAEWFWLMAKNIKPVENRDWPLNRYFKPLQFPIRIFLHASKTRATVAEVLFIEKNLSPAQLAEFRAVNWKDYRGTIIGEITITKQIRKHVPNPISPIGTGGIYSMGDQQAELEILKTECPEYFNPWFFGEFGFVVKDGVLYDKPIPYRGQLGFFKVVK